MERPLLSVVCNEPDGDVVRNVWELEWTPENLERFAIEALKFPTLYGTEVKTVADVVNLFMDASTGSIRAKGLFYVIDDFVGVFYLTDFSYNYTDALAHYTFFDRRHKGRINLVKQMLKLVFNTYKFNRLSVEVPLFTSASTRRFVGDCGFTLEGKKRKSIRFKDEYFDILMFGILKSEVLKVTNGRT